MMTSRIGRLLAMTVLVAFTLAQVPTTALADGRGDRGRHGYYKDHGKRHFDKRHHHKRHYGKRHHGKRHFDRHRRDKVIVVRPGYNRHYGHRPHYVYKPKPRYYPRKHYRDDNAFVLFGLGAVTLGLFALLNQQQQYAHQRSQAFATTAPVGRTITWNEGGAAGSVVVTRDGRDQAGRYCREYQHTVTVSGRRQQAWGTACQQPDGAWEIIN